MVVMFKHGQYLNFAIFLLNSTPSEEVPKLLKLNHFLKKALGRSSKLPPYFTPASVIRNY